MNEKEKRQNLITKVHLMIREVNKMASSNRRLVLIHQIDALASFMYYAGFIKLHEYQNFLKKISHNEEISLCHRRANEVFMDLFNNNELLMKVYGLVDSVANNKKYDTSINYNEMCLVFNDFLREMNLDSLFKDIKDKDMFKKGVIRSICINNIDSSYIVIGNVSKNDFEYFRELIHEISHAYVNKELNKNKIIYYDGEIYQEIIPILLEKIFIDYLVRNKILDNNKLRNIILKEKLIGSYNIEMAMEVSIIIKKDFRKVNHMNFLNYKKLIGNINPFIHHYALGYLIADNYLKLIKVVMDLT